MLIKNQSISIIKKETKWKWEEEWKTHLIVVKCLSVKFQNIKIIYNWLRIWHVKAILASTWAYSILVKQFDIPENKYDSGL